MLHTLKKNVRYYSNIHTPSTAPNIFIFSAPRSGSTWLMELIRTQPGFKSCAEPLNLRNPDVRQHLGLENWNQLYDENTSEKFYPYFEGFCNGSLRFMNSNPLNDHHRFATSRIVFKILHGGEDRINWFAENFNGRIVLLLRHPLAVTVSREVYPRLETFLNSNYQKQLTNDQKKLSQHIIENGTLLEKGVLSWCLQYAIPLTQVKDDWLIFSYEQMVLEPTPLFHHLAKETQLPQPALMLARLQQPSGTSRKSDEETRRLLAQQADNGQMVVSKWRKKVDEAAGSAAMDILNSFGLDLYSYQEDIPTERYWIKDE